MIPPVKYCIPLYNQHEGRQQERSVWARRHVCGGALSKGAGSAPNSGQYYHPNAPYEPPRLRMHEGAPGLLKCLVDAPHPWHGDQQDQTGRRVGWNPAGRITTRRYAPDVEMSQTKPKRGMDSKKILWTINIAVQWPSDHPLHQMGPVPGERKNSGRSCLLGFGFSHTPRRFLVVTLRFYHDRQLPTTKRSGQDHFCAEYGHRRPQSREGGREQHPSKPRLRTCSLTHHNDPGELLSLQR